MTILTLLVYSYCVRVMYVRVIFSQIQLQGLRSGVERYTFGGAGEGLAGEVPTRVSAQIAEVDGHPPRPFPPVGPGGWSLGERVVLQGLRARLAGCTGEIRSLVPDVLTGDTLCTLALALTCTFPLTHTLECSLNTQPHIHTFSRACACFCSDFTRRYMLTGSRSHPISDFLTNPLIHCPSLNQLLPSHVYLKTEMHFLSDSLSADTSLFSGGSLSAVLLVTSVSAPLSCF